LSWQDVLAVALLVVVAAPVAGVPGTRHVVWQFAAWELQIIMQLVTVELCARRICWFLWAADAAVEAPTSAHTDTRMTRFRTAGSRMQSQQPSIAPSS
jgi:hypothetical protein